MVARPLPPVIGATENALRTLLTQALAGSLIGGYSEWIYLNIRERADAPVPVEDLVADALKQPREIVVSLRTRLIEVGLLDTDGSLTSSGLEQLGRARAAVSDLTAALTAGIDPAAIQTTIHTLDTVRTRAEHRASPPVVGLWVIRGSAT